MYCIQAGGVPGSATSTSPTSPGGRSDGGREKKIDRDLELDVMGGGRGGGERGGGQGGGGGERGGGQGGGGGTKKAEDRRGHHGDKR